MVNCQIYDRFIEPVKVMLNRKSIPANPYLEVNTTVKDFFDFKPSDFIIKDFPREEIEKKNSRLKFDIARF
jgi:thymidylate synthase